MSHVQRSVIWICVGRSRLTKPQKPPKIRAYGLMWVDVSSYSTELRISTLHCNPCLEILQATSATELWQTDASSYKHNISIWKCSKQSLALIAFSLAFAFAVAFDRPQPGYNCKAPLEINKVHAWVLLLGVQKLCRMSQLADTPRQLAYGILHTYTYCTTYIY